MDPDEKLAEMRNLVARAKAGKDVRRVERELRWAFEELDEWLSKGGFLPSAWTVTGHDNHDRSEVIRVGKD